MRIVSHRRLVEFYSSEGHGDAQVALERWYDIAEKAEWKNLSDIKADFPSTDYVGNQHYVFDIRGNKYRLVVVVKFTTIINRATLTIFCPWALQGIQEAVQSASWPQ